MHRNVSRVYFSAFILALLAGALLCSQRAGAITIVFFDASQATNLVASGTTSDTLSSQGYLFTYTRDKLFTGGVGMTNPIGRMVRVHWPAGLEAQAVTAGPTPSGAEVFVRRQDGQPFDITSFTGKLLANTGGAGGAFEIMPLLNGEDALADPFPYNASGSAGMSFTHPTPQLTNYEGYKIKLYVDYALTSLTLVDADPPPPYLDIFPNGAGLQLSWTATPGYQLYATTNLAPTAWFPMTNNVVTNLDLCTVDVEAGGAARFFRLQK